MTDDQAIRVSADDGWTLGRESWPFHRAFHHRFGQPMAFGEYTSLGGQVGAFRRGLGLKARDAVDPVICFVATRDGQIVAVQEAGYTLHRIIDGDSFVTPREAWAICRAGDSHLESP